MRVCQLFFNSLEAKEVKERPQEKTNTETQRTRRITEKRIYVVLKPQKAQKAQKEGR